MAEGRVSPTNGYPGHDRFSREDRPGGALRVTQCWAHSRRGLMKIYEKDASPIAAEGLKRIAAFYEIEAKVRSKPAAERLEMRKAETAPLLESFQSWLSAARERVSKKSRLGEALSYIAVRKTSLSAFMDDGRIELATVERIRSTIENRIRPQTLTRKNALFAGHDEGGRSWARITSLIETARLNDLQPFAYLRDTLTKIAHDHPASKIDHLLPWNYAAQSVN